VRALQTQSVIRRCTLNATDHLAACPTLLHLPTHCRLPPSLPRPRPPCCTAYLHHRLLSTQPLLQRGQEVKGLDARCVSNLYWALVKLEVVCVWSPHGPGHAVIMAAAPLVEHYLHQFSSQVCSRAQKGACNVHMRQSGALPAGAAPHSCRPAHHPHTPAPIPCTRFYTRLLHHPGRCRALPRLCGRWPRLPARLCTSLCCSSAT